MTSLNTLITSIDKRLFLAEQAAQSTLSSSTMFDVQEKMKKYVLVHIDKEKLAIPIEGLSEIGPMPAITPLPNLPTWIYGIINQRGDIVSVINLIHLLQGKSDPTLSEQKLAILRHGPMKVGICIDSVGATISRPESESIVSPNCHLTQVAPEVFSQSLQLNDTVYQILQTDSFLNMDRLMQYYIAQ